ncbi:asparaginase [Ancrocorticia populi]|uniref:Asparaginase n=1 Tax=Ancrocorticia populi TaxID=2175228 RepID=A0A2V1K5Y8_9ACTO|nr:asparaginase [Ancrocorticia populi]PWF25643.1 asparaginase [Ancrocorticia populi]
MIAYLATGGTIASIPAAEGSGAVPTLTGADLLASVPGIGDVGAVEVHQMMQRPSASFTLADVRTVQRTAQEVVDAGASGVVVSQGTDTIEEVAYLLDLLWDRPEPIVVTGAMRHPGLPGADGPANLSASFQVASSLSARDLGVLVVLNDEIHAARFVHKSNIAAPDTFGSPGFGPLGYVVESTPRLRLLVSRNPALSLGPDIPPVALWRMVLGDDGRALSKLQTLGYEGAVIEGAGGGHVSAVTVPFLRDLVTEMPVVLASRTGSGEMLRSTYQYSGSEMELLDAGLISAGSLDGLKARLLLTVLISAGASREEIEREFALR